DSEPHSNLAWCAISSAAKLRRMPLPNSTSDQLNSTAATVLVQKCFESNEFMAFENAVRLRLAEIYAARLMLIRPSLCRLQVDHILLVTTFIATIFNILVIACGFKLYKRTDDTMHLFVICMTFGDLLLTAFAHPHELITRRFAVAQSVSLCSAVQFTYWVGIAISGLALTLLNIDKLIYFRWPLKYLMMSRKRAAYVCLSAVGISLGYVGYVWLARFVYVPDKACILMMVPGKKYIYEIFTICFCILPVVSSAFLSIYLYRLTRQRMSSPGIDGGQVDMPTLKNKLRSLVFIFATTAWTAFSLLPYRVFNIFRIYAFDWSSMNCDAKAVVNWTAWILIYLLTLNAIVNPFITSFVYAPYRRTLIRMVYPNNRRASTATFTG
ncbi:Protein AEXR-1, partial [Aphelenchoides avenae]